MSAGVLLSRPSTYITQVSGDRPAVSDDFSMFYSTSSLVLLRSSLVLYIVIDLQLSV